MNDVFIREHEINSHANSALNMVSCKKKRYLYSVTVNIYGNIINIHLEDFLDFVCLLYDKITRRDNYIHLQSCFSRIGRATFIIACGDNSKCVESVKSYLYL